MGWLKDYWQELVIVATLLGALLNVNYQFRRSKERHDESDVRHKELKDEFKEKIENIDKKITARIVGHEDICAERYGGIEAGFKEIHFEIKEIHVSQDRKLDDLHNKVNEVGKKVAFQSGLLEKARNDNTF